MTEPPEPQLPLSRRRAAGVALGGLMGAAQLLAALLLAPVTTGTGNADPLVLSLLWGGSVLWSTTVALLLVRQADVPDIATSSFIVTISTLALFALRAAFSARGTSAEVDLVDTLFLGVTLGALTGLLVFGIAMSVARVLRLPTTAALRAR